MLILQPDELLAVEPGGRAVEQRRHIEFSDDNVPHPEGTEWFTPSKALLSHIATVAAAHPVPALADLLAWAGRDRKALRVTAAANTAMLTETFEAMTDDEIVATIRTARGLPGRYMTVLRTERGWPVTRIADELNLSISAASRAIKAELAAQKEG